MPPPLDCSIDIWDFALLGQPDMATTITTTATKKNESLLILQQQYQANIKAIHWDVTQQLNKFSKVIKRKTKIL